MELGELAGMTPEIIQKVRTCATCAVPALSYSCCWESPGWL